MKYEMPSMHRRRIVVLLVMRGCVLDGGIHTTKNAMIVSEDSGLPVCLPCYLKMSSSNETLFFRTMKLSLVRVLCLFNVSLLVLICIVIKMSSVSLIVLIFLILLKKSFHCQEPLWLDFVSKMLPAMTNGRFCWYCHCTCTSDSNSMFYQFTTTSIRVLVVDCNVTI